MNLRTTAQSNRFHALLTMRKLDKADKRQLVQDFTDGREKSSAKMTYGEMDKLIKHLEGEQEASIKRMRSKLINIAKDIFGVREMTQENWDALNVFLTKKYKAQLHQLGYEALRNAVTSLEKWREHGTNKLLESLLIDA